MKLLLRMLGIFVLTVFLAVTGSACAQTTVVTQDENQKIVEEFIKAEATFRFDGIPETLKIMGSTATGTGLVYTVSFECRHAGYGDRSGQILAEAITPHNGEVTVEAGKISRALLDGQWDMLNQQPDIEIYLAPIDAVTVSILKSNPAQINIHIKGGLPDGGTTFHDIVTTRDGSAINIKVTVQRPRGRFFPAIYTNFEKDINLDTDFQFGTTYTLHVNDYTTTFEGTLMQNEGLAIYLTRDDIPPAGMEMLSQVDLAGQPFIAMTDIITYNARTHEITLTAAALARVSQLDVPVQGKSFMVCVNKPPVYWGAFWTPLSSQSFSGVTIWKPLAAQESTVVSLELGYPSPSFYNGADPRNNPAIFAALDQAGKLIDR